MAQSLPLDHPELKWLFTAGTFGRDPYANGDFLSPQIGEQFPEAAESYLGLGAFEYGEPSQGEIKEQEKLGARNYGSFSRAQLKELLPALIACSEESSVYAFFEAGEREDGVTVPNEGSSFYRASLEEMHGLCFRADHHGTPTYWWSADREWLIHSDPDSSFALLASRKDFAERLLGKIDFVFERFNPETRYFLGIFDNPKPTRPEATKI
jgi:hypothetical protein